MKKYRRLSRNERDELARLINRGHSLRKVAFILGRSHTSLSRELRSNQGSKKYWPYDAHLSALQRRRSTHRRIRRLQTDSRLRRRVIREIKQGWTPEIIAGRLKRDNANVTVISHETIYQWIYAEHRALIKNLVRSHPRRRPRWVQPWPKRLIPQRVSITQRPMEINLRHTPGHWESDLVWGAGRCALQVSVERKTRFTRLRKLPNKTAQASYEGLADILTPLPPSLRKSITYDNGSENMLHVEINQRFQMRSFFCQPYHAWEKGTVENTNGLIRRFLPKRTNFNRISPDRIQRIEDWLNARPRKCLNFNTPAEALAACGALAT